jgi:glutamyl-tRNA reductase
MHEVSTAMEIVVIGLNHRTAGVELRERVSFSKEEARDISMRARSSKLVKEILVLSTCNRTELYGVPNGRSGGGTGMLENLLLSYHELQPEMADGVFYQHQNRDAVRHLYRVTSGLDSMLLGEAEILGQVRMAYADACDHGATGRVLNRLFQSAIEVGKRVRTDTEIGVHPMSVAFAGVKLAEGILSSLKDRRALILGAGLISEKVLRHLCNRGIHQVRILNRRIERAQTLAARYGGEVVPWENLENSLEWPDLLVTSVSSPEPVLTREMLKENMAKRKNRTLMLIDLGVPRNIAAGAGDLENVFLHNIDSLNEIVLQNRRAREKEIPRAEAIIEEHIENFTRWQAGVSACSILRDLRAGPEIDRETFLRKHTEAMSHYSDHERVYVMELLKKFLNGTAPDAAGATGEDPEMWSKVRALGALCNHLEDEIPRQ